MAYIALYRQWRPGSFKDLVGQTAVSRTLSHAISAGRIAHAYLFSGPRGTGKTSTAKILAKSLNCEKGPTPDPCGVCKSCTKIADGTALDVFEIDAASNRGIDEMRDLREKVKFTPAEGRYKVYIIDEVHMLTTEAFNALLKTLEEPPEHVVFILATTEPHKVPATIQSRCQRFDFRRITVEEIEARLAYVAQEMKIPCEKEALRLIARQADGGMRDALSLLDQCASLNGDTLTAACVEENLGLIGHEPIYRLTKAIGERAKGEVLETIAELLALGKDPMQLLAELTLHLRSLMICEAAGALAALDLADDAGAALEEQKALFTQAQIMAMIARLHEAMAELRWTPQPRITLEVALLSLCSASMEDGAKSAAAAQSSPAPAEAARIARLEAELAALKAALAAQKTSLSPIPSSSAPAARQRAASRPAKAASAGTPASSSAPLHAPAAPVSAASAAPNPEGEKIYAELLSRLQEKQRISVLACLKGASFSASGAGTFRLHFASPLLARRTMRDDYRKIIEELLAEIAGEPLSLSCEAQDAPKAAPPPAPKKKPPLAALDEIGSQTPLPKPLEIDESELSSEERSRLQNAVSLLGGHLVDLPEEQRIAALAASGKAVAQSVAETAEGTDAPPPDDVPSPGDEYAPPSEENS
ncbi:MAG: DNA polymerase III subunit gamma/tau [Selenomonas sp.]